MNAVIRPLNLPTEAELATVLRTRFGNGGEAMTAVCGMLHASVFGTAPDWQRTRDELAAMCAGKARR